MSKLTFGLCVLDRSSFDESNCSTSLLLDGVVDGFGNLKLVNIACGESIKL